MVNAKKFVEEKTAELREALKESAILGASGGVDSTVCAALAHRAAPKHFHAVHVDTGLLREGEVAATRATFKKLGVPLRVVNASDKFFRALKGVTQPEKKRKAIGELFIRVFEEEARRVNAKILVQGTIAPDWLESGGALRDNIKSHHNVGGLPEKIGLKIVEPLRDLYKDEVRAVARELGIPSEIFERQPFPGPGLAVRIIGEVNPKRAEIVRKACFIVEDELKRAAKKKQIAEPWQYFAVLLPVKSVGVQGDLRAYKNVVAIRAVDSIDAMTATPSRLPSDLLEKIATRLTNELKESVNRVVYDVTEKPPSTVEWE